MIPGIDPRVDIAFKKLFGSPEWPELTMSLIDAVLKPAPWERLKELELLNPYTEPMKIDEKVSILDIKARDDQGRLFNVEMQMATTVGLRKRFLYYWSRLYSSQLARGDDYDLLHPTIVICFVDGRLFPAHPSYHRRFQLLNSDGGLLLTEDLAIHVLELVNFDRNEQNLTEPLDRWLYFFNNGAQLDTDALPMALDTRELRQAMEVLQMYSQDEMARELYEGRLKRARDEKMYQKAVEEALAQLSAAEQQRSEAERALSEAEQALSEAKQARSEAEQARSEAEQQCAEAEQQRNETGRRFQEQLAARVQLCEQLLGRPVTNTDELMQLGEPVLQGLVHKLEQDLLRLRQ